jgi:5'-phosphate synthase pdxT subunit
MPRPAGLKPRIGVLALQGDVAEHRTMLARVGAHPVSVKRSEQLAEIDGLIIPGGESTTIGKLLRRFALLEPLRERVRAGFPVYGTCAGLILLADEIEDCAQDQPAIGGMDVTVQRNAFGRQRESFETDLSVPAIGKAPLHGVFIRAPLITRVGEGVEVLAVLPHGVPGSNNGAPAGFRDGTARGSGERVQHARKQGEIVGKGSGRMQYAPAHDRSRGGVEYTGPASSGMTVVAAQQGRILVSAFHPELTDDDRMHRYFVDIVEGRA